jgi:hypothetical protein
MRTIVDLPEEQREALAEYCSSEGISRAEAVRRAVSLLIQQRRKERAGWHDLVQATAGLWKDRDETTDEYLEKLRAEWDR